jgi:hypothetical protein
VHERVAGAPRERSQVLKVARIGEGVKNHYLDAFQAGVGVLKDRRTKLEPMKPAPPVTRIFTALDAPSMGIH